MEGNMDRDHTASLREHLLYLLRGGGAHLDFDRAIAGLPPELRGARPDGVPHTPWRLLEHLRIAQWDILEFSRNPRHVSPRFPDGYWPGGDAPPDPNAWDRSVAAFRADLLAMQELVADPATDLFAPLPHGEGQTLLREALLVADHNAYHLGQLVVVRRRLGAWTEGS
jgi:DinB superfamily